MPERRCWWPLASPSARISASPLRASIELPAAGGFSTRSLRMPPYAQRRSMGSSVAMRVAFAYITMGAHKIQRDEVAFA